MGNHDVKLAKHACEDGSGATYAPAMGDQYMTMTDGTTIHFTVDGIGDPALVLVHGWCSRASHWTALIEHFTTRHRVLAVDRRGHGESDTPASGYSAAQHSLDMGEILRSQHIAHAVLIGHAGGGPTTLLFARDNPELVSAVVLVDTRVSPASPIDTADDGTRSPLGQLLDRLDGEDGEDGDDVFATLYSTFFSDPRSEVARRTIADAQAVPLAVARAELATTAIDTEQLAREIPQPVLWISVEPAEEEHLNDIIENVRFGRVIGSGHFPQIEAPEQVNALIGQFLDSID